MQWDTTYIIFSIILAGLWLALGIYMRVRRGTYVVPRSAIATGRRYIWQGSGIWLLLSSILIPLQIQIPWWVTQQDVPTPIQLIRDMSLSMTARDIAPSRGATVRSVISDITTQLDHELWLITYAGLALDQIAWTDDDRQAISQISDISRSDMIVAGQWGLWSALWDALVLGIANISDRHESDISSRDAIYADIWDEVRWYIVIFSDWGENSGIQPLELIDIATAQGIQIINIVLWSDMYDLGTDVSGMRLTEALDISIATELSEATSGYIARIADTDDISTVTTQLIDYISDQQTARISTRFFALNHILIPLAILYGGMLLALHISRQRVDI